MFWPTHRKIVLLRDWLNISAEIARALEGPVKIVWTAMTGCWMPRPVPMPMRMSVPILRCQWKFCGENGREGGLPEGIACLLVEGIEHPAADRHEDRTGNHLWNKIPNPSSLSCQPLSIKIRQLRTSSPDSLLQEPQQHSRHSSPKDQCQPNKHSPP